MKRTRTFALTVEREEGGYLAHFASLPGCHSWGASFEEAVSNAEEALALYLETLAADGVAIREGRGIDAPISLRGLL